VSEDPRRFVVVKDESHALLAIGLFTAEAEGRRWGNMCLEGAEGDRWGVAQVVKPEDYDEDTRTEPRTRIVFDCAARASAFTVHLFNLLPMLEAGNFLDYFLEAEQLHDGTCLIRLKRPMSDDLLAAFITLTRRTRLPVEGPAVVFKV
jgi:hypothetical protein